RAGMTGSALLYLAHLSIWLTSLSGSPLYLAHLSPCGLAGREDEIPRFAPGVGEAAGPCTTVEPGRGPAFQERCLIRSKTPGTYPPISGPTRAKGSALKIFWTAEASLSDSCALCQNSALLAPPRR